MATYLEQSLKKLEEFEGSIPWMYRDSAGNVTVGVGLMLANVTAAIHLAFLIDGRSATKEEIASEFARVDALPMGRPALFYRGPGNAAARPELPQPEIDSLLLTVLTGFEGELRSRLPAYDSFPDGVKIALLDMAYNLGPAVLLRGFPRLLQAVEAGAWAQAAAHSERYNTGAARNAWTRHMFLASGPGVLHGEGEGVLKQVGYGLVGITASLWTKFRKR